MKQIWTCIQIAFSALGGYIGWFLGGFDGFLYALIAFVVVDYATGLMVAIVNKKVDSSIGFRGIFKKVVIFLLVGVANIVDVLVLGQAGVVRTAVIFFYLSNEGISVLENTSKLGVPYPQVLKDILAQLKDKDNDKKGDQ